ncbi:MAG: hypothetical protein JOZ16_01285 [Methylobacteriaceae bacterium]|nr:hypothetical protein [Methylobacteriaceae bacterium]
MLLALISPVGQAHADPSTKLALSTISDLATRSYFQGLADGMGWANADARYFGKSAAYCEPPKLALTTEQVIDIVQRYAEKDAFLMDKPLGATMIAALKEVFPCR